LSAFAGNPLCVDLDVLKTEGLLKKSEIKPLYDAARASERVNYALQEELRLPLLMKAAARFEPDARYRKFCKENAWWLDDFAGFISRVQKDIIGAGISEASARARIKRMQFFYFLQWRRLKVYANARGVGIVGDLPLYIGTESADYASRPELFATGKDGAPKLIAGVPPDAFTSDGQIWNEPVYDWKRHKRDSYAWWISRFRQASYLYDLCRIDHFRAFAQYFAIPAGRPASEGKWMDGPGKAFIDAVKKSVPALAVIAEDLGIITDDVHRLRAYSGYPGMRVLQFAFEPDTDSSYLPHNHVPDCVVYTGTHDNPTLKEWASSLSQKELEFARDYLGVPRGDISQAVLRAALCSVARTVVIPMQDYMGLGASARVNTPGIVSARNWSWRLDASALTEKLSARVSALARSYGRS
jgi:4-alpha-glucanotransferase